MGGSYPLLLAFAGMILFTGGSINSVQAEDPYPEDMAEHNLNKRNTYGYGGYTPPAYPPPTASYSAPATYAAPMPTYSAPTYAAPTYAAPPPVYAAPTYAAPMYAAPPPYYSYPSYYPSISYSYNYTNSSGSGSSSCNTRCAPGPAPCRGNDQPPCTCTVEKHPEGCTQTRCGTQTPSTSGSNPYKCICNAGTTTPTGCTPETATTQGANVLNLLTADGDSTSPQAVSLSALGADVLGTPGTRADLALLPAQALAGGSPLDSLLGSGGSPLDSLLGSSGSPLDTAGLLGGSALPTNSLLDTNNLLGSSPLAILNTGK